MHVFYFGFVNLIVKFSDPPLFLDLQLPGTVLRILPPFIEYGFLGKGLKF